MKINPKSFYAQIGGWNTSGVDSIVELHIHGLGLEWKPIAISCMGIKSQSIHITFSKNEEWKERAEKVKVAYVGGLF